jgi:hypothetical protein
MTSTRPLASALAHPRAPVVVGLLALLVTLPSLTLGFVTDDYGFRAVLRAPPPYRRAAWDLFRFASGDPAQNAAAIVRGQLPWWTASDLRIHFVRPLTGLLFAADTALFGDHAVADHAVSIAWYLALVLAVGALYRRVLTPGAAPTLALLVFAWSHAHVLPYAWLAARHVLVGGAPAVLALWAHVRWRKDAWGPGLWLAPLALVVGLAGSEVALAGAVFWVSFDLLGDRTRTWAGRFGSAAPAVLLTAAYLLVYRLVGGGARASGGYHDPLGDPAGFAGVAVTRVPVLLGDALLGVPAELAAVAAPTGLAALAAVGVAATVLLALGYAACRRHVPDRERTALRWLLPAAVASTLLGATGFPGGRVLVLPDVGFAALVGVLLAYGPAAGARRAGRVAVVALLVVVHLVLAPLSSWRSIRKLGHRARASEQVASHLAEIVPATGGRVFLVASDPLVFLYPRGILADVAPGELRCLSILSAAHADHRLTRIDERTLALEPVGRTLLDGSFDTLFRAPDRPLAAGDTFLQCGATIRVTDVRDGRPSRLEVAFDRSLDSPSLAVMVWREHRLERLEGMEIGKPVDVAWTAGPGGL